MKLTAILPFLVFAIGCADGNCRAQAEAQKKLNPVGGEQAVQEATAKTSTVADHVKVFKYDGSKQCGQGKTIDVDKMQKDLGTIKVYSAVNKPDGLMHIQVCGSNTGRANVYEIDRAVLAEAIKKGFSEWTFE